MSLTVLSTTSVSLHAICLGDGSSFVAYTDPSSPRVMITVWHPLSRKRDVAFLASETLSTGSPDSPAALNIPG